MEDPATALWGLRISDADFEKLSAGFEPQDMDDRWKFAGTDLDENGKISVHMIRSCTVEYYVLVLKPSDSNNSAKIEAFTWERNRNECYTDEERAKKQIVVLCRNILGCNLDEFPDFDASSLWDYPLQNGAH